jgi:hypothetical protein
MKTKRLIEKAREIAEPFRVNKGKDFRLKHADPGSTLGLKGEDERRAKEALTMGIEALAELQDRLYAQDKWSVLLIFQAMDAAGKDGTIKHVMSGVNPQLPSLFVQVTVRRGPRPRLPMALHEVPPEPRPHRHLQPQLLRGNPCRARASRISG